MRTNIWHIYNIYKLSSVSF